MNVIQFILEICTTYDETNLTDKINNELIDLAKEKDTIYLIHLLKQDHLHFACKFTNTNCDMKHLFIRGPNLYGYCINNMLQGKLGRVTRTQANVTNRTQGSVENDIIPDHTTEDDTIPESVRIDGTANFYNMINYDAMPHSTPYNLLSCLLTLQFYATEKEIDSMNLEFDAVKTKDPSSDICIRLLQPEVNHNPLNKTMIEQLEERYTESYSTHLVVISGIKVSGNNPIDKGKVKHLVGTGEHYDVKIKPSLEIASIDRTALMTLVNDIITCEDSYHEKNHKRNFDIDEKSKELLITDKHEELRDVDLFKEFWKMIENIIQAHATSDQKPNNNKTTKSSSVTDIERIHILYCILCGKKIDGQSNDIIFEHVPYEFLYINKFLAKYHVFMSSVFGGNHRTHVLLMKLLGGTFEQDTKHKNLDYIKFTNNSKQRLDRKGVIESYEKLASVLSLNLFDYNDPMESDKNILTMKRSEGKIYKLQCVCNMENPNDPKLMKAIVDSTDQGLFLLFYF